MKHNYNATKRGILIFILMISSNFGFSQMWFSNSSQWKYIYSLEPNRNGYNKITVVGEEMKGDILCKKISIKRYLQNITVTPLEEWVEDLGFRYLYEANNGNQVFIYENNQFYKLMDFDANIDDTWEIPVSNPVAICSPNTGFVKVIDKGVEVIDGLDIKWIKLNVISGTAYYGGKIYQKIGATQSFFIPDFIPDLPECGGMPIDAWFILGDFECYSEDGFGYGTQDCLNILSINSFDTEKDIIKFYNTGKDINIELNKNFNKVNIVLVDINGRELFKKNYINPSNNIEINASDFPTGIYIIKINADNKLMNKKLILN